MYIWRWKNNIEQFKEISRKLKLNEDWFKFNCVMYTETETQTETLIVYEQMMGVEIVLFIIDATKSR